jgi:uncharacterized protein YndB with AHSA1/START domain
MKFQKEVAIQASPEVVFAYISDLTRHPEWGSFKMEVEKASEGPVGLGTTFKHVGRQMGMTSHDEVAITEYDPPRRLVYESDSKLGHFRHTLDVAPADGGTRLSKTFDLQKRSFMMKLFTPTILILAPRQQKTDLDRIKQNLEKAVTPS